MLNITPAPLSLAVANSSRLYGEANPPFDGTITGLRVGDNISPAYTTTATPMSPVGDYPISALVTDPDGRIGNYDLSVSSGTLTVEQAPLVIAAADMTRGFRSPNPALTGTITGLVTGDDITANYITDATQGSEVGNYAIIPSAIDPTGKLGNYNLTLDVGTLTIVPAGVVSISLVGDQVHLLGSADANITYKVQFSSDLSNWTDIGSVTAAADGSFEFTDPNPAT
jgi:hypothetical protein